MYFLVCNINIYKFQLKCNLKKAYFLEFKAGITVLSLFKENLSLLNLLILIAFYFSKLQFK